MRRTRPRRRATEKRKSLVIPLIIAIVLIYVDVTLHWLDDIPREEAESGEEVSPGLIAALSNEDKIAQAAAQLLEEQQQQHSLEPSVDQLQTTDDVDKKALQWLQNNHVGNKGVINSPPKFNPPPGYWEHPHQEYEANTALDQSLIHQQYLERRHNKLHHSILPKKVITVVGPESSGSTFLATTLAAAAGAGLGITKKVNRRARTVDGKYEIQHLSLPWGWICESNSGDEIAVNIVDAMVPGECFRYELAPSLDPVIAEQVWIAEQRKGTSRTLKVARDGPQTYNEAQVLQQCRDKVFISEESNLSCGAKCGSGVHNGYTLYPRRFSVNITSHIEWYLQRGVDVTVVLSTRDRSISKRGKENAHCKMKDVGQREDEVAMELMKEGLEKYGPFGSIERGRVIVSSYEALMSMKKEFLFGLYKQLRINSTYVPIFIDGNEKYVTDANEANLGNNAVSPVSSSKYDIISARQPKPARRNYTNPKASFLPKKLITVVGLEGSGGAFLSTTLGEAVSSDGEYGLQHISLPYGWTCESSESRNKANIVDALVPEECFCYEDKLKDIDPDPLNTRKCQEEARISENNKDGSLKWRCGAKCGEGQFSGLALYPDRFYVNITSHIQWYLTRGVDAKVVLLLRDKTISNKEKLRSHHCHIPPEVADIEDDTAMEIMREAYQRYGEEERVMVVSYEGLMQFQQSYLFGIYKSLGIESTYVPDFVDENRMFVAPDRQHQMHGPSLHKKRHDEDNRK
jgi:RecA/RadA recombinase